MHFIIRMAINARMYFLLCHCNIAQQKHFCLFKLISEFVVSGSPFVCQVIDINSLQVNWETVRLHAVGQPIEVLLHTNSSLIEEAISCNVFGEQFHPC